MLFGQRSYVLPDRDIIAKTMKPKHVTIKDPCDFVKRFYGTTTNNETHDKQTSWFVPSQKIWISTHNQEMWNEFLQFQDILVII